MKKKIFPIISLAVALMMSCTSPDEAARFFASIDSMNNSDSILKAQDEALKTNDSKTQKVQKKNQKSQKSTQSTKTSKTSQTTQTSQPTKDRPFILTGKGVGPVKMDMKMKKLPKSVNGLYDKYSVYQDPNEGHIITFTLNGETVMEAYARYDQWEVGNDETLYIWLIRVKSGDAIGVKIKGQAYGVGDDIKALINQKIVKRVYKNEYKSGDITIIVSNSNNAAVIQSLQVQTKIEEIEWP